MAATMAVFSNKVVHSENGKLVVIMMLPRSLLSAMILKSSSD